MNLTGIFIVLFLMVGVVSCTKNSIRENEQIVKLIEGGTPPLQARCAITGNSCVVPIGRISE